MNYNYTEITFPSSDGIHTIYADIYTPKNVTAKGVVQLCHGMRDYVKRYEALAEYLTGEGYILAGNAHLGHGKSVQDDADFGYFADTDGIRYLLKDIHSMNKYLRATYPALPLFLMGHSMGSFLARLYTVRHPHSVVGVIIHGTAGPNPAVPLGKLCVGISKLFHGARYRSKFLAKLAFFGYNSKFPKEEGASAWLTRDVALVANREDDPFTKFVFTVGAYGDLFEMLRSSNEKKWFESYPKDMPTLIMSGDMDPVGNYGRGPEYVYKRLLLEGASQLTLKIYEGARHELFSESNRDEVFRDMVEWLSGVNK